MKPKSKNNLLLHAHAIAQGIAAEAGIEETHHWPWRWDTEDGIIEWSRFGETMVELEPLAREGRR